MDITSNLAVVVKAVDEDGEENGGEFAEKSMTVSLERTEEGEGWFEGAFEASGVVVEMELQSSPDAGADAGDE